MEKTRIGSGSSPSPELFVRLNISSSIRRLTARVPRNVASQARDRISRRLSGFDWKPSGLDENAILCARSLRMPLNDSIGHPHELIPPESSKKSLANALDELVRDAIRPAEQAVPANASAVLFRDQVDLLVCLARDWVHRDAAQKWWWAALFPGKTIEHAVLAAWLQSAPQVPIALKRLHLEDNAVPFLARLKPEALSEIIERTTQSTATSSLRNVIVDSIKVAAFSNVPVVTTEIAPKMHLRTAATGLNPAVTAPPWSQWIVTENSLPPEAQALLVISILLHDAAIYVHSHAFHRAIRDWAATNRQNHLARFSSSDQPVPSLGKYSSTRPAHQLSREAKDTKPSAPHQFVASSPEISSSLATVETTAPPPSFRLSFEPASAPEPIVQPQPIRGPSTAAKFPSPVQRTLVSTEWAGIFYLLNVAQSLRFYADFTRPRDTGLDLCPWEFLALLGNEFSQGELQSDPLWGFLANLSGRSADEPPGGHFDPPGDWRIPRDSLIEDLREEHLAFFISANRLQIRHLDGFALCDVAVESRNFLATVQHELARLGVPFDASPISITEHLHPPVEPLVRWTLSVAEFIEYRLRKAIGPLTRPQLVKLVFQQSARIELASERIIIHFNLQEHPIELRFAGLDRDLGWIPAAARAVYFRYE